MKCFNYHHKFKKHCKKKNCRYWINSKNNSNCCIVISKENNKITLEDIGTIFDVTRMRICQIEKAVLTKIRKKIAL